MIKNSFFAYRSLRKFGFSPGLAYEIHQKYFSNFAFIHINKCGGTSVERALGIPVKSHDTASELRKKIGGRWDKIYKFSVVRNPYYRVESLYRYRVKNNYNLMSEKKIALDDWIREVWVENNPFYLDIPKMFRPCKYWITDTQGKVIVNEIIKLEEIQMLWPNIASKLGGGYSSIGRENSTIGTSSTPELHMSAQSKEVVLNEFKEDFSLFNYAR